MGGLVAVVEDYIGQMEQRVLQFKAFAIMVYHFIQWLQVVREATGIMVALEAAVGKAVWGGQAALAVMAGGACRGW
ncbi:MAG TPA: hypothetical protein PLI09_10455 [Candidatus Hydrogenedentes bacterium]|nr:hypothetical protein [Candidatus Hydrogenedentota bacterium]